MALLLRAARRPLIARSLAPTTAALYRPRQCGLLQSAFSAFSTTSAKSLSFKDRIALLPATIKAFHARHGHFIMGFGFTVPLEEDSDVHAKLPLYPAAARGLSLGTTLYCLLAKDASRRKYSHVLQALDGIGFPVDVDWKQYVFEHVPLAALYVYRDLHGDCHVPQSYVVPTGDARWPIETWGFKLGIYTNTMRSSAHRSLTQEQLNALAAVVLPLNLNELPFAERLPLLAPTLRAFHARHGHFIMLANFTVPKEDDSDANPHVPPYPAEARGTNLGTTLHRLLVREQSRQKHSDVLQELAEIGFPVDVDWRDYVFEHQRLPALRVHVELFGDCVVPQWFIVPNGDAKWPNETWGLKLGEYVMNVRRRDYRSLTHEQLEQLDALGFWWGRHDKRRPTKAKPVVEAL